MSVAPRPSLSQGIMKNTSLWDSRFELSFKRYTDLIEPMSIDEAYLDVTENKLGIKSAVKNCSPHSRGYLAGTSSNCFCRRFLQQILS